MLNELGVEDLSLQELENLFNDDGTQDPPPATETDISGATPVVDTVVDKKEATKAFAKRLKESTDKAVLAERETIAKNMGYSSYDDMVKDRENKLMSDRGLDPEQVSPVVEELVKQRLNDDPRIKELETYRRQRIEEFGKKELAEITALTGGEITKLSQLPKAVIELWKTEGSLKDAYMKLEGAQLITKLRSEQSKGTVSHLNSPTGTAGSIPTDKRPLTDEEKALWKFFNPKITDEELNKKTIDK